MTIAIGNCNEHPSLPKYQVISLGTFACKHCKQDPSLTKYSDISLATTATNRHSFQNTRMCLAPFATTVTGTLSFSKYSSITYFITYGAKLQNYKIGLDGRHFFLILLQWRAKLLDPDWPSGKTYSLLIG